MMIQGKSCTLNVAKDGYYYPLPYSEETIRLASKGYALPGVIGERNREKLVITGKTIQGCFVTRLEYQNVLALFLLLFSPDDKFDVLTDRKAEKLIYKNLSIEKFELRADNDKPFYLRIDVKENDDSYVTDWDITTPSLFWNEDRTYFFNGHNVLADLKKLPLVYRFELNGSFTEKSKYQITLYFPLSTEHFPNQKKIEKLTIQLDPYSGVSLDLYDLQPVGDMTDINCADTVLCYQKYNILSNVVLNIRNEEQNTTVVL